MTELVSGIEGASVRLTEVTMEVECSCSDVTVPAYEVTVCRGYPGNENAIFIRDYFAAPLESR